MGLTNHDAVGEDEEGDIGSEGTEDKPPRHHHPSEDGDRPSTKIHHTNAADRTWRERGGQFSSETAAP